MGTLTAQAGHGPNIGHGWVKYLIIDGQGRELPPVVFPALIARAQGRVAGALRQVRTAVVGGERWWVGDDALLSASPLTLLAQERLTDPSYIPALLTGALQRLGALNGAATGFCVTGLPATWAQDRTKAQALAQRLREATDAYRTIRVIAEPLGLVYSVLLDNAGDLAGAPEWQAHDVLAVDGGQHTLDIARLQRLAVMPDALDTAQLGMAGPLGRIRTRLNEHFEVELSLLEVDQAVRAGTLLVSGTARSLPRGWDRPLVEHGELIVRRLIERIGSGARLAGMVLGGGMFAERRIAEPVLQRFAGLAQVAPDPQLAIARGYARLARRLARSS
jgi:hypothetical protein